LGFVKSKLKVFFIEFNKEKEMSINRIIDIKENKLLNTNSIKQTKANENHNLSNSKRESLNNNKGVQNNEKSYKNNNYLKVKGGKESISVSKTLEKLNSFLEPQAENTKVEFFNRTKEEINNLNKFNLGIQKNNIAANSRNNNNNIITIKKSFNSDEKKDADEGDILILNTNKFDSNSNNKLNLNFNIRSTKKNININNLNSNEISYFKTIEVDKSNDKLKQQIERNEYIINNTDAADKKKKRLNKLNLKEKKYSKEKSDFEEINKYVHFKGDPNLCLEENKLKQLKKKKSSMLIDVFNSKGDANIIDKKYKKEQDELKKKVSNEVTRKKSALIDNENIILLNNNKVYFKNLSPIKTNKKDKNEINKHIQSYLFKSEKEDKGILKFFII